MTEQAGRSAARDPESVKITIIVPVYNMARSVEETAGNILAQTHCNIELVLVDDGSTDDTWGVFQKIAASDARVKILRQSNAGPTAARLHGVREAAGEWIGFVDADDRVEPQMYARLLENALRYGADISHCGYQMVYPDGSVRYYYNTGRLAQQDKLTGLQDLLAGSRIEPGLWNKLFHNSLFHSLLHSVKIDLSIRQNEDLLMNYYLFKEARCSVWEDICPYHYRQRPRSGGEPPAESDFCDPIRVKEQILCDAPADLLPAARSAYLGTVLTMYNGAVLRDGEEFARAQDNYRRLIREHYAYRLDIPLPRRYLAVMILRAPRLYRHIYRAYRRGKERAAAREKQKQAQQSKPPGR